MKRKLFVSECADADLRQIWRWTYDNFGEAQADRYPDELDCGMRACTAAPKRGKNRSALRAAYWSRLVRRHVVSYNFTSDQVLVQRVLHASIDFEAHLPGDE